MSESTSCYPSLSVDTMGTGIVSQAGAVMLLRTAEKTGLGGVLCAALATWRKPLATHDPGKILLDLGRRGHRPGDEADGPAPAGPTRRTHSPRIDLRPGHGSGVLRLVLADVVGGEHPDDLVDVRALTGTVQWPAAVMFAIIFFWPPPHTWALAMRYKEDYKAAGVPMLPVIATAQEVTRKILMFSWAMVAVSLLLLPAAGWLYAAVAVTSGAWFLVMAHRLHAATRAGAQTKPMKLFHLSNTYLSLLFVGIAVDSVLSLPTLF